MHLESYSGLSCQNTQQNNLAPKSSTREHHLWLWEATGTRMVSKGGRSYLQQMQIKPLSYVNRACHGLCLFWGEENFVQAKVSKKDHKMLHLWWLTALAARSIRPEKSLAAQKNITENLVKILESWFITCHDIPYCSPAAAPHRK